MLLPGTPCEAGVMIYCGTENQQKTNFPDTPTWSTYWVLLSDTFPLCEDSHINAISLPHLKLQKKCTPRQPEPAFHDHCALLCSAGCRQHTAQLEAGWMHFQTWSTFKTSRERKALWWALLLTRGKPEEHRWFWSQGLNGKTSAFHYLTIHENEHKGGFHLNRSSGVRVGR